MKIREAGPDDGPELSRFFLQAPLEAGTAFVLDRSPDFFALLRLRGQHRTFVAFAGGRLVGTASALWHPARDGQAVVNVGEVVDLRVAPCARGGRAVFYLLSAVREALVTAGVSFITCLIGDANAAAAPLVMNRAGFPLLAPLARYASVHYIAWRVPRLLGTTAVRVRRAHAPDFGAVRALLAESWHRFRFAPAPCDAWLEALCDDTIYVAHSTAGELLGTLVLWDGSAVRRIRVLRYRGEDRALRGVVRIAAATRCVTPLPSPGGELRMWASRALVARDARVLPALVTAALHDAAAARRNVVQINVAAAAGLLRYLPRLPRSIYYSTLYGTVSGAPGAHHHGSECYVDVARA